VRRGAALAIGLLSLGSGALALSTGADRGSGDIAPAEISDRGEQIVESAPGVIQQAARLADRQSRHVKPAIVFSSLVLMVGACAIVWRLDPEPTMSLHRLCSFRPSSRAPPAGLSSTTP